MTNEAYGRVVAKNIELEDIQIANRSLKLQRNALAEEFDKLTKDVLIVEKEWEFLLLIQVCASTSAPYTPPSTLHISSNRTNISSHRITIIF